MHFFENDFDNNEKYTSKLWTCNDNIQLNFAKDSWLCPVATFLKVICIHLFFGMQVWLDVGSRKEIQNQLIYLKNIKWTICMHASNMHLCYIYIYWILYNFWYRPKKLLYLYKRNINLGIFLHLKAYSWVTQNQFQLSGELDF